jgi:hypothetical protein
MPAALISGPMQQPITLSRVGRQERERLVNGFVNETPRNDGDGVERSVMA